MVVILLGFRPSQFHCSMLYKQ